MRQPLSPAEERPYRHSRPGRGTVRWPGRLTATALIAMACALAPVPGMGSDASAAPAPGGLGYRLAQSEPPQAQLLTALDGSAGDWFGYTVAVSGDTAIVGAPARAVGANEAQGCAYVFVRSGTEWVQQQKLVADDGAAGDLFGTAVAISGDTAIVMPCGFTHPDGDGGKTSSVYVFTRSGSTWTQQQEIVTPHVPGDDEGDDGAYDFGSAVALSGDTALIGGVSGGYPEGYYYDKHLAFVYVREGASWRLQQEIKAPTDGIGARGFDDYTVALSGDSALIGAPGRGECGTVYFFARSGTSWSQTEELVAGDGAAGDAFGWTVALSGSTAVIGAPNCFLGTSAAQGAAYVFERAGTSWSQVQKLVIRNGVPSEIFGLSIDMSDDALVVSSEEVGLGSGYVFLPSSEGWVQQRKLVAGEVADTWPRSVAIGGDTALVGAGAETVAGQPVGVVYAFPISFELDAVAPRTTATVSPEVSPPARDGWHDSAVSVRLSATDANGVDRIYYRLGGSGAFSVFDPDVGIEAAAEGSTPLEYYAVDYAGNVEATRTMAVKIDTRPPTRSVAFATVASAGRQAKLRYLVNDPLPGSGRAKVTIYITRNGHAVRTIHVPGQSTSNVRQSYAWRCTVPRGTYDILVAASDMAGNSQGFLSAHTAKLTVR